MVGMNNPKDMIGKSKQYLDRLCLEIPTRLVGTEGNLRSTRFFSEVVDQFGWQIEETEFSAMNWREDGADLEVGGNRYQIFPSPYAKGISLEAEILSAGNLQELQACNPAGKILLMHGELSKEQLMPKNFIFYNPQEHQEIISLLELKDPAAILCATDRDGAVAGGVYPFPLIEDGDFQIPSVYMTGEEGQRLLLEVGSTGFLESRAWRKDSKGYNIVAQKGSETERRILISAHIDAKVGTPGAIDNGTGVVVLLLLAELFRDHKSGPVIELLPLNGEDYYSVPGQMVYLEQNQGRFDEMLININIDGAGYHIGPSAFSPFNLEEPILSNLKEVLGSSENLIEGVPWYQGDHSIFLQQGIPAIAVSSAWFVDHVDSQQITHTPADHPDIVNHDRVVEIARAIQQFILAAYLS
jgi:aminopeptidase YwaD